MNDRLQRVIGQRIRLAREAASLTQEALSATIGFKDRQILSNIEAGRRTVTAEELVRFAGTLNRPLDFFTDAFILTGEAAFSWRARKAEPGLLDNFEEKAGRWLAIYRRLTELQGVKGNPILPKLALNLRSSFEDAAAMGEALAERWSLDKRAGASLYEKVESDLGVLILMVDAPASISGAACQLPEFFSILINRGDPPGRRQFDFAHELFHLLTWDALPPRREDYVDRGTGYKAQRIERMAENFAGGLLMPRSVLEPLWAQHAGGDIHERLPVVARKVGVTAQALRYRVTNLGWLSAREMTEIDDHRLAGPREPEEESPPLFSKIFIERLRWGLAEGRLSARKAARLLDLEVQELATLIKAYGLEAPFDL